MAVSSNTHGKSKEDLAEKLKQFFGAINGASRIPNHKLEQRNLFQKGFRHNLDVSLGIRFKLFCQIGGNNLKNVSII